MRWTSDVIRMSANAPLKGFFFQNQWQSVQEGLNLDALTDGVDRYLNKIRYNWRSVAEGRLYNITAEMN